MLPASAYPDAIVVNKENCLSVISVRLLAVDAWSNTGTDQCVCEFQSTITRSQYIQRSCVSSLQEFAPRFPRTIIILGEHSNSQILPNEFHFSEIC